MLGPKLQRTENTFRGQGFLMRAQNIFRKEGLTVEGHGTPAQDPGQLQNGNMN